MITRFLIYFILMFGLVMPVRLTAQTKDQQERTQILDKFEQWKLLQYKLKRFVTDEICDPETITKRADYTGSELGIPKDVNISFSDINNDHKVDGLITFNPEQCDGGNGLMNIQIRVLILSNGTKYSTNDTYIDNIENRLKKGWIQVDGASSGMISGNYFEYKDTDGHCCPSIKRPFTIDYRTKKLVFKD
jgi:hypothetical protein